MNRRQALGLFGAFAALVIIVVLAAWLFGEGDRTRQLAIVGVGLGSAGALKHLHDIWEKAQERKKKADESAEKVIGKPLYDVLMIAERTPGVELYNAGKIPVPIKRVFLCIEAEGKSRRWIMHTLGGMETRYRPDGTPTVERQYPESARLEPGDPAVEFYLQFMPDCMKLQQLMELPPEQLSIRVESNQGIVAEVKGADIQDYIKKRFRPAKAESPAS